MAVTALPIRGKRIRLKEGMYIAFTYQKLDGTMRKVDAFLVDRIYVSKDKRRIIQGWRGDGEGRSYRRERMSNVTESAQRVIVPNAA